MKLSEEEVKDLCKETEGYAIPANYNCPGQIVISGETKAIDRILELAKERKVRAIKLSVSAPFHCEMMAPAAEKLIIPLNNISLKKPDVSIYMNVDAMPETDTQQIREKLIDQAKSPVYWEQTIRNMYQDGVDTFIELGPGKTLSGFVKKTLGEDVRICHVTDLETLKETVNTMRG